MAYNSNNIITKNELMLNNLLEFYKGDNLLRFVSLVQGDVIKEEDDTTINKINKRNISLRIIDWFVTNYSKKNFVIYERPVVGGFSICDTRFKVYNDYKLMLKSHSKANFDPFCRWARISIPIDTEESFETTIGQLNFFKWAIENRILEYIEEHYQEIESDMNLFNSASKRRKSSDSISISTDINNGNDKTRKKREELSISACKCIRKETIKIVVKFT